MNTDWIFELKNKAPSFLEQMKGKKVPGFFKYSLSGDLYPESSKWGLGNTVFATKIYYTLGLLDKLPEEERKDIANFIKSFQDKNGEIADSLLREVAFFREKLSAIRHWNFNNFFHQQTARAETRQAISVLKLLGEKPDVYYKKFPQTEKEIEKYLSRLDWTHPWGAGSHFSHLVFFLANSELNNKDILIDFSISWVNKIQHENDGAWYKGNPSIQQKINGAMKVITALKAADKVRFEYAEKLIDLCLSATNDRHACENFNIIYVLKYANELLGNSYRYEEIKNFALNRLEIYKKYYWPEIGGFSFIEGKAGFYYYKSIITKGLPEPDIHGTVMFLWGISIIAQILGINDELGFREQIS